MSHFAKIAEMESLGCPIALCTVVEAKGSTPRKPGAKMIVMDNNEPFGHIIGTIGGGAIEHQIRKQALESIRLNKPLLVSTSLRNELGMCCGGEMTVFIEPISKKPDFICFGAGHIAQAICPLAMGLGFQVNVVDERMGLLNHPAFLATSCRFNDMSIFSFKDMPFSANTYVVVATHDHDLDQQMVERVLGQPFKYLGLVGSTRKALMTRKRLMAKGFDESSINRIYCPAGIEINAATPEEIAISIAAQMTMVKNDAHQNRRDNRGSGQ